MQKNRIKNRIYGIAYVFVMISFAGLSTMLIMYLVWWNVFWVLTLMLHIKYGNGK